MSTQLPITNPPLVCWNCHERTIGTHFCPGCGKLLQLPQGSDYFAMFELPRKLWIEMGALEQKFLQLSWKLHPDNFVSATEQEREISLKRSSELNDAYRTLRDPIARVEYLLAIEGMRKNGENRQQAPPELLEEVFELNESLDELREAKAEATLLRSGGVWKPPKRISRKNSAKSTRNCSRLHASGIKSLIPQGMMRLAKRRWAN